jgi:predicted RNA-binding Zn-ribbon protein involved in translation (DUF1610 family)
MSIYLLIGGVFLICCGIYLIYHNKKTKIEKRTLNFLALELPLLENLHCPDCGEQLTRQRANMHIVIGKRLYWSWLCPKCSKTVLESYNEED